ncbi:hypothetical protein FHU10_0507 [Serratia fonticola]|jgi:hypothetical protein|uniref:Uncharacterized protein n=1 Tax=Serratia fonticola TaxID=47917 RepID=A0A542D670_SERFO|nr:hypothetical protein FHU09_1943 [Serratia fonticola]TQI98560.1 hypothetical protein FHU11_4105 [Serratia fonticola]TVZ68088.1 hypothetical protein FHU10_0507 [Serratia fonticola]
MFSRIVFVLFAAAVLLVLINWERIWEILRPLV